LKVPKTIKVQVQIKNNRFVSNLPLIRTILESYNNQTIDIEFKKRTNKRSINQNSYYWGVIIPIIQNCIKVEWGEVMGTESVHEFLKHNCNYRKVVNEDTGEVLKVVKSTTENSTVQQETFHDSCRALAKNFFNTVIPLPNQDLKIEF